MRYPLDINLSESVTEAITAKVGGSALSIRYCQNLLVLLRIPLQRFEHERYPFDHLLLRPPL